MVPVNHPQVQLELMLVLSTSNLSDDVREEVDEKRALLTGVEGFLIPVNTLDFAPEQLSFEAQAQLTNVLACARKLRVTYIWFDCDAAIVPGLHYYE